MRDTKEAAAQIAAILRKIPCEWGQQTAVLVLLFIRGPMHWKLDKPRSQLLLEIEFILCKERVLLADFRKVRGKISDLLNIKEPCPEGLAQFYTLNAQLKAASGVIDAYLVLQACNKEIENMNEEGAAE